MAGIYIHIPFCKKACHYCNFHFSTSTGLMEDFVQCLLKEIELQKHYLQDEVSTIYFGGGTPSLLPEKYLLEILSAIRSNFQVSTSVEITLESNPDDITTEKLEDWKKAGVERLSLGIQSFFDEDLLWMNRAHNSGQAKQSIGLAQQAGFNNITIDLIYGTPTLTDIGWQQNLEMAFASGVQHLSCYALTVEPKTALDTMIRQKKLQDVDSDKQARHFEMLMALTEKAGFEQYEISNFALPGFRSKHNSSYWQGKPYLGLGPSAHSYNGVSRQWNIANNALYNNSLKRNIVPFEIENLTPQQQLNEYIMTSLRTIEGLNLDFVKQRFGQNACNNLLQTATQHFYNQTLQKTNNHLVLTAKGKFLADGIASDLFQL